LQSKLDNLQFQLTLKDKDVKNFTDKYKKIKNQNVALRGELSESENKLRIHDSVVHALKDQISFFKSKAKERDRLIEELSKMKSKLKHMESIQLAVNGSREEVNDMLKNENDIESLVILAATLKKALLDAEKKKLNIEYKFKQLQNDVIKYRKEITSLETLNKELRKEVETSRSNWAQEKGHLTAVIKDFHQKNFKEGCKNVERIIFESPAPLPQKHLRLGNDVPIEKSPSVEENVVDILQSDSPYLCIKRNVTGIGMTPQKMNSTQVSNNIKKMSIFRRPGITLGSVESSKSDVVYNGLGGQSKEDLYPVQKVSHLGVKRHNRLHSCLPTKKFRRLNSPLSSEK
jgi:hypothetical protein